MEIGIPWYLDTPLGTIEFVRSGDGIRIQEVEGMDGATVRSAYEEIPQGDGAVVFDSFRGARFPVLTGILKATETGDPSTDLERRRELEDELRSKTDSLRFADGTLRFQPNGAAERQLTVRLLDAVQIRGSVGIVKEWQLALIAGDPLIYSSSEYATSTGALAAGIGAEKFPHGFPYGFGTEGSGGTASIVNGGTAPTYPRIRVYGPASSPVIQNATTDVRLALPNLTINDGDFVEILTSDETIQLNGSDQFSLLGYLEIPTSEFWTLAVGANLIQFYGGQSGSAAKVTVYWRDAFV